MSGLRYLAVAIGAIGAIATGEVRADELQARLLQAMRASDPEAYGFQRTIAFERTGAARKVIVERYDPRAQPAQRWSLVSVDGRPASAKEVEQARKAKRESTPSYRELAKWFGAPAVRIDAAPGHATYRFDRLPAGAVKIGSHDASPDMHAEAYVNMTGKVPFVERVRFTSTKAFRMMLVASVQSIDVTARYAPLAGGAIVPATSASVLKGSMLGKSGQMTTAVTYAGFEPVR